MSAEPKISNKEKAALMYAHGKVWLPNNALVRWSMCADQRYAYTLHNAVVSNHRYVQIYPKLTPSTQSLDALESYSSQAQDILSKSVSTIGLSGI